jgi:hypothetical protein
MKKMLISLVGAALIGAGNPAFAGPDWQIIEHGRKVAAERWRQAQAQENKHQQQSNQAAVAKQTTKPCHETDIRSD